MSISNFIPEIWSQTLLISLKEAHIGANLVNRNYQGDIANQGDTVHITTPSAIPISDYDGSDFDFDEVASTQQSLVIDQAKAFHFQIRDLDQVQSNVELRQPFTQEAGHGLGRAADQFIFEAYSEAAAANVLEGFADPYDQLTLAAQRLSEANVPDQGRWAVIDPAGIRALSNDPAFQRASDLGDQTSREGFMGRAAGFDVYMSNNLVTVEGTGEDPDVTHYLYGHNMAITFADQLLNIEAGRREKNFGDFVKGLHVYGKKVVRPTALGTIEVPGEEEGNGGVEG